MRILIKVTKAVLVKSAMCGGLRSENCAIACAVKDLFPMAKIGNPNYSLMGESIFQNELPESAIRFINKFDASTPAERINLPEFSFEIEVPQSVIDKIGISEAYRILSESKTLELVNP